MDYISVKEAAEKFNISERRVQKLCETQRIEGCSMVSGVWLIPSSASKPIDERLAETPNNNDYISLPDLCTELSISTATGRNWLKLGKLTPENPGERKPFFTREYLDSLKKDLKTGENKALKSRRNKKFVSGNALYNSYVSEQCQNLPILQKLLSIISEKNILLDSKTIQYLVCDCALHLLGSCHNYEWKTERNLLYKFLCNEISVEKYDALISALIDDAETAKYFCKQNELLFGFDYVFEPNEDVLGLIYISCKNMGNRKATGSYYTSTKVVKKLIDELPINSSDTILDPCCGTGNFLLQLPSSVKIDSIYGNDIDEISVKITRLNMALKYNAELDVLYSHITHNDFLTEYTNTKFNYIIGNPPWGYDFSDSEKETLRSLFSATTGKNIESYDVFIEQSLRNLASNGQLSFVLPEALLNVKAHSQIRNIILEKCSIKNLDYLGNAFDGVQCPCIIMNLQLTNTKLSTVGMRVNTLDSSFIINTDRLVTSDYFSFSISDEEYTILEKIRSISNAKYLLNNADFALGIVTGNNKDYISTVKTNENEMVLKGADISKYHINPTNNYIVFDPERFQQVAPTEMYRAPEKLLYRFISSQLVFAYDNKQTLSLNSCNIVIPKLPGIQVKYILAILNSRVAQFIYKKEFNSVKVLRSHIENIPIPQVDEQTQANIIDITNLLISGLSADEVESSYDRLDYLVCKLFNLSDKEIQIIKSAVDGDNKFLA